MTIKDGVAQEQPTETIHLRTQTGDAQPTFRLTVTRGPDAGQSIVVDGAAPARLLVGTGATCHFRLTDRAVSLRHLALSLRGGALGIEDLGSTNGTYVGTLRVRDASLEGGEEITIALTGIRVERLAADASVAVARAATFGRVIGSSVAMRRLYPALGRLAHATLPILIEGEAGTGKELTAEALHEEGPRSQRELVVFDARSTSPDAMDAQLFGTRASPAAVEQSRGGTIVIDEPSELPLATQLKLTRLLEGRSVLRDDGSQLDPTDIRAIVLSRSDVEREVHAGRLQAELAAVLSTGRIELPPLRDREGDVALLAAAFFKALDLEDRSLHPLTVRRFEAYSWPGNVRELKNAVLRYAMSGDDTVNPRTAFREEAHDASPDELYRRVLAASLPLTQAREIVVEDFDRRFMRLVLDRCGGNVTRAAAVSGLARRYFQMLRIKRGA